MKIDVFHHFPQEQGSPLLKVLTNIHSEVRSIMTSQTEFAAKLQALADQANKSRDEVLAALAALQAALAEAGAITPEVQAAFDNAQAAVQGIDDLNPDAPV